MPFELDPHLGVSLLEVTDLQTLTTLLGFPIVDKDTEAFYQDEINSFDERYKRQRECYSLLGHIPFELPNYENPHIISLHLDDFVAKETLLQDLLERLNTGSYGLALEYSRTEEGLKEDDMQIISFSNEKKWKILESHNNKLKDNYILYSFTLALDVVEDALLQAELQEIYSSEPNLLENPACSLYLTYFEGTIHFFRQDYNKQDSELEEKLIGLIDGVLGTVVRE